MADAKAQWISLRPQSCAPGFESQAKTSMFFQFVTVFWCEKDDDKQKEAGIGLYVKKSNVKNLY